MFLSRIERLLFETSRTRFIGVMLLLLLVKVGVWTIPNYGMSRLVASHPFVNPFTDPYAQYLYWNWLAPFVAWSVGATGPLSFFLFHLAFAAAFTILFVTTIFRRLPDEVARASLILFCALPASGTVYFWVGMDAVVLFLMLVPLLFPSIRGLPLVAGLALGMQHFEQGFAAGVALLLTTLTYRRMQVEPSYPLRFTVEWLAGTVVGKGVLICLFERWNVPVNDGRMVLFGHEFQDLLGGAFFHAEIVLWSAFGVGWIALFRYVDRLRREAIPCLVGLLACSPFLVLARDETRVVSIVTFPVIAGCLLLRASSLSIASRRDVAAFFLLWLIIPWMWAWNGVPRWSATPYDVMFVLGILLRPWVPIDLQGIDPFL